MFNIVHLYTRLLHAAESPVFEQGNKYSNLIATILLTELYVCI